MDAPSETSAVVALSNAAIHLAVLDSEMPSEGPALGKRKRNTGVAKAEAHLNDKREKVSVCMEKIAKEIASKDKGAMGRLKTQQKKLSVFKADVLNAMQELEKAKADKEESDEASMALHAQNLAKIEVAKNFSDSAACELCELRCQVQHKVDNTSDTVDSIWKKDIWPKYNALINTGVLSASEARSVEALQKRYTTEFKEFKLWSAKANRAVTLSGVPADMVEEQVLEHQRPTTKVFIKWNMHERASVLPPYQIQGALPPPP